ncbi:MULTISPECIES: hypothetical protein [Pseudomonas]|jgi:hypothetical protein|uniref:hypothetical protein n=1 Tax=Pseudomonas sp. MIL9 TaxID=2807620 RepID=UPI00102A4518|nr:hypothetical protein [Pseudomonas sp. MIL9]MBM6443996.1 hypothetical protein [Pseudomonas sp. MIL9]RZO04484.1 hypothetical protein EKG40_23945 [Pseudomonas moorei]
MKNSKLAVLILAASLSPTWALAAEQSQVTQTQQQTPNIAEFDKQMAQAQETFQKMQAQMEKIQQTQDPQQRQKLLQEHWNTMQSGMSMMNGMWGPGMMGCCGGGAMMGNGHMMRGGHMMGWQDYSNLPPEQKSQRQYMMDRYTGMQQMMMNHMMWHQNYMQGQQPAKPGK